MPTGGGAPSTGPGPLNDLNVKTPVLRPVPMLGSNPTVSDVHFVLYSLFNTFRQLSEGTPLSPPFPYGFASPVDACARGLRRMLMPSPLTSEFVGMASYAPTSFPRHHG